MAEEDTKIDQRIKNEIVKFLRNLADRLESNSLPNSEALQISEFFMKFKFVNSLFDDIKKRINECNECDQEEESNECDNEENEEMYKFLSLGWYVYKYLLPQQQKEEELDGNIKSE